MQVKVVGLREYHGNLFWSWLMAYSGKVAKKMGDDELYGKIEQTLQTMAQRDGVIHEIYTNDDEHAPFKTRLYFSEGPFSWGASSVIEMLMQQQ